MESQTMINLNKSIYANNNNLLVDAVKKLEKLSNETKDKMIISRIKDIIEIMNKIINNNQQIRKDIEKLNDNINEKFKNLEINIKNNFNYKNQKDNERIKIYEEGRYEGDFKNGWR